MRGISPVLVFRSLALTVGLALAACGSDSTDASLGDTDEATTTLAGSDDASAESTETTAGAEEPQDAPSTTASEGDIVTTSIDGSTDDDTSTDGTEDVADEIGTLCTAYLDSISFGTAEEGLATLAAILGPDAPAGVQDALDTLQNPNGDIEGFFSAQNSLDSYVLPICRDRFRTAITPLDSDEAAADAFVGAVRDGDQTVAESLAPTNVIVSFDWNGFPDTTWEFEADNSTVSMLLEPTVTVFCQIAEGAVEACAFGE